MAVKNITVGDMIRDNKALGKNDFFVEDRNEFVGKVRPHLSGNSVLLLMGARDHGLEQFAKEVFGKL